MVGPVSSTQTSAPQAPAHAVQQPATQKKVAPPPEKPVQDTVELSSAHGNTQKAGGH